MLPEVQNKVFSEFYDSISKNDILDHKTTLLIQAAAAIAVGCGS